MMDQRNVEFKTRSTKSEARSSKQIQMIKTVQIPNEPKSDSRFWIFRILDLFWPRFVSDFDIRILNFYGGDKR